MRVEKKKAEWVEASLETRAKEMAAIVHFYRSYLPETEPSTWLVNLALYLRRMFGFYSLVYALIPFVIRYVPDGWRVKGGYNIWTVGQVYIFGVRVARWVVRDSGRWSPDKRKKTRDEDYLDPGVVKKREAPGASVCIDDECDLSGGYAHIGPCEACGCGKRHAIEECPATRPPTDP